MIDIVSFFSIFNALVVTLAIIKPYQIGIDTFFQFNNSLSNRVSESFESLAHRYSKFKDQDDPRSGARDRPGLVLFAKWNIPSRSKLKKQSKNVS